MTRFSTEIDQGLKSIWFEALAGEVGAALWVADPHFERFLYLSDGFAELWGGPVDDLHRDAGPFFDGILEEDRPAALDADGRPLARHRNDPWDEEFRVRGADGQVRWIRNHGRPVYNPSGELVGFAGFAQDISEEKYLLEEHQRAREELSALFRALPDLVLVLDREGRYLRVASGDSNQLYRPEDELVGRTVHDVLPAPTADLFLSRIHEALDRDHRVNFRYSLDIGGGTEWFDAILVPLGPDQVLWVARTITDTIELERQLSHASKLDALGQLAGGIAHDFNNVITVIRGTTSLLAENLDDPGALADLGDIRDAANRASSLTRQLLAFSRQQVLHIEPVVVAGVIEQMGRMLSRIIGEHIELEIDTDDDGWTVMIDPGQLEQIVANLVINARHAVADNGRIRVTTAAVRLDATDERVVSGSVSPGDHILLTVSDTGVGMDEDTLGRAFEPFFTTKPAGEGTGLGLSMVYGTVRQCGGHVEIRSQPGEGTEVGILLPRSADAPRTSDGTALPEPPAGANVLLVEDEGPVRQVVRRFLESAGHEVREAVDGEQALLRIAAEGVPDLVVTDLIMPRLGGAALVRRIRESHAHVPIIIMSGYTGSEIQGRAELDEARAFLSKPFSRVEFLRAVSDALKPA